MGRSGQDGCEYSRLFASGAARECGRNGEELWRAGSHRDPRPGLSSASAHQRDEHGVAARISCAAAIDTDRARNVMEGRGSNV